MKTCSAELLQKFQIFLPIFMELLSSVKRKTRVSSSSATLSTEGIPSPENKRIKDVEDELSCHEGIRSLRKRVTSQTVSSQTSSVDSQTHPSRFANVI